MKRFGILAAAVLLAGSLGMGWAAMDAADNGNEGVKAQGGDGGKMTAGDKSQITGNLKGDGKLLIIGKGSHQNPSGKGFDKSKTKGNVKAAMSSKTEKNSFIKSEGFTKQPGAATGPGAGALPAVHN